MDYEYYRNMVLELDREELYCREQHGRITKHEFLWYRQMIFTHQIKYYIQHLLTQSSATRRLNVLFRSKE